VKQCDGTLEEMHEDEVIFEKTDEDIMIVATTLVALTQGTTHNITIMNGKVLEKKS
jgi:hypothetical protein